MNMDCNYGKSGRRCYSTGSFAIADLFPGEAKFVLTHFSPRFDHSSDARRQSALHQRMSADFDRSRVFAVKRVEVWWRVVSQSHSDHDPPKSTNIRH